MAAAAHNDEVNNMGRQSQQRISNQHKRKYKLCSNNNKRRKGDQLTLEGGLAFQAERDCRICKAKITAKFLPGYPIPKRAHDPRCALNKTTRGAGELTTQAAANIADEQRYKQLTRPINQSEKFSATHLAAATTFFAPRPKPTTTTSQKKAPMTMASCANDDITPSGLCAAVMKRVNNVDFREKHKKKAAPLAMIAFAEEIQERYITPNKPLACFDGISMTVPSCHEAGDNPYYHSIVGQKLLYVDWIRIYGLEIKCPDVNCKGILENERTNFSKNKTLFPVFGLEGPPMWCIVQRMDCNCCRRPFFSTEGEVLASLPPHVADDYPVETTYAEKKSTCHITRNAAEIFATIMITYGNGELCSKLLYDAINRAYMSRIKAYYSLAVSKKEAGSTTPTTTASPTKGYIEKDGEYVRQYPPLGDTIRDLYNNAASSTTNRWRISDFERHTREIQGVKCDGGIFAQDHTFEPIKNYQKTIGAKAAWDAATQTGEIALVVLVPSTKTKDFAHAAQSLLNRSNFNPNIMYSDTWPHKAEHWGRLKIKGCLGLFHYQKRIIGTLRKTHCDYFDAITDLLAALYAYYPEDYEKLLTSLKDGSLSKKKKKYTSNEITAMKGTKQFRDRYAKCLRKQMHGHQTIIQMLDGWFQKYKVTSSDPDKPGYGRLDPVRLVPLFTAETKQAVENCKEKAQYLSDPFSITEMYHEILPSPNATHNLSEWLSNRGESKLEAFHDRFAHFTNCGMRASLADNLNLAGTARYNLSIRHVRSLTRQNPSTKEYRKRIPAAWEKVVPFFNHSELWYVNRLAKSVGCKLPFATAETLVPDNGERFFSQYITTTLPLLKKRGLLGECLCHSCTNPKTATHETHEELPTERVSLINDAAATTTTATTNNNNKAITPKPNRKKPNVQQARQPTQCAVANGFTYMQPANYHPAVGFGPVIMPQLIPMQYQLPLCFVPQMPTRAATTMLNG